MSLRIEVQAPNLSPEATRMYRDDVTRAFRFFRGLRRGLRLPAADITAIAATDFVAVVEQHLARPDREDETGRFVLGRIGGVVAGKTLPQDQDEKRVVIVLNSGLWDGIEDPTTRLIAIHTVGHELAHAVIGSARRASGAMDGIQVPARTGWEVARASAELACDEYRADRLSEAYVRTFVTATRDGVTEPIKTWWIWAGDQLHAIRDALVGAYPAWPQTVQDYREWRIPLADMFQKVVDFASQSMSMLANAQAMADGAGAGNVVELPEISGLPAVRLYLAEPWSGFLAAMRSEPLVPTLKRWPSVEGRIWQAGQEAVYEIWKRLRVTIEMHLDDTWGIRVVAPTWDQGQGP